MPIKLRILIFLSALFMGVLSLATGLVLYFWPRGPRAGWIEIMGMNKAGWSELHTWFSLIALLVILVHLAVNWNSIKCYWRYLKERS